MPGEASKEGRHNQGQEKGGGETAHLRQGGRGDAKRWLPLHPRVPGMGVGEASSGLQTHERTKQRSAPQQAVHTCAW